MQTIKTKFFIAEQRNEKDLFFIYEIGFTENYIIGKYKQDVGLQFVSCPLLNKHMIKDLFELIMMIDKFVD
jgi:hypothetical protein